jgi:two-component system, NarL family, nitrate/nitrite response regulator NarL
LKLKEGNLSIRIAVVDDHPLFLEGLVHTLGEAPEIKVVARGASVNDVLRTIQQNGCDIFLLDINIPGSGLATLESIIASDPKLRVIILTVSADQNHVAEALRLGARGYLPKGVSGPELLSAIRAVHRGESYLSPTLAARMLMVSGLIRGRGQQTADPFQDLSNREEEILGFVGQGLSNKEIGSKLALSEKTVKHHVTNLLQKLSVQNRVQAALLAQSYRETNRQSARLN